jgi:PST family polysaccharide transporter
MTLVKLGAVFAEAPLLVFPALETVESALIGLGLFCVQRVTKPKLSVSQRCTTYNRELVCAGLPILLGSLAVMLYMRSDILLLGKMAGLEAAGIYAAAAQITEGCALFPMAFLPALFPVLVRWRKLGLIQYEQRFENLFQAAILVGSGIAIGLSLSAPSVLRLLYGNAYASAALILGIHSWSAIFIYLSIMQSGYDIIEGLTWIAASRVAAGASLNIVLNLLLIPRHGGAGAAVATLISQFCSAFLFNLFHPRTNRIFVLQLRAFLFIPLLHSMMRQLPNFRRSWNAGSVIAQQ